MLKETKAYQRAKQAPKGAVINCPTCHRLFTKNHPRQAFCKAEGHRCKDRYHNSMNEKRLERMLDRVSWVR